MQPVQIMIIRTECSNIHQTICCCSSGLWFWFINLPFNSYYFPVSQNAVSVLTILHTQLYGQFMDISLDNDNYLSNNTKMLTCFQELIFLFLL